MIEIIRDEDGFPLCLRERINEALAKQIKTSHGRNYIDQLDAELVGVTADGSSVIECKLGGCSLNYTVKKIAKKIELIETNGDADCDVIS